MSSRGPRIAVVGGGPAGLGVLTALLDRLPLSRITLFDPGGAPAPPNPPLAPVDAGAAEAFYDAIYAGIWRDRRRAFPPPKTQLARPLPSHAGPGGGRFLRGDALGGLSNYWGGTCLPFTNRELSGWPVDRARLDPWYRRLAEVIGIAGRRDELNRYVGDDYVNRPPLPITSVCAEMIRSVNGPRARVGDEEFEVYAGVNRCAVETRPRRSNSCVACGECLAGCYRDSIFSAHHAIARMIDAGRVEHVRRAVRRYDARARTLEIGQGEASAVEAGPFDRIYLAAGCPGTTEIALRSLAITRPVTMADNSVYVFPILYGGDESAPAPEPYLSLTNLLISLVPRDPVAPIAQVQVYANFDYLWRYNLPLSLWRMVRGLVARSRARLLWGRLYMDGRHSQSHAVSLDKDSLAFAEGAPADASAIKRLMPAVRAALSHDGFHVPSFPPILQKSGTHYAGTLANGVVDLTGGGAIADGIYVCDSSNFSSLPAISPTFTIMANAARIAEESL